LYQPTPNDSVNRRAIKQASSHIELDESVISISTPGFQAWKRQDNRNYRPESAQPQSLLRNKKG
jgi:hypothetical protein